MRQWVRVRISALVYTLNGKKVVPSGTDDKGEARVPTADQVCQLNDMHECSPEGTGDLI